MDSSKHLERAVLHGLIVWPNSIERVAKVLTPADFEDPTHQQLFSAALSLLRSKKPIEVGLWAQEAGNSKLAYIADLTEAPVSQASLDEYCKGIREAAQLRRLRRILNSHLDGFEGSSSEVAQSIVSSLGEFKPITSGQDFFVDAARFCSTLPADIEWLVQDVIPVGSNGIIAGEPKAGKSFTIIDLALSLASGTPFLGFRVPKPVRVGLIAREDYPGLTSWRINALRHGRTWPRMDDFCDNLYVNTRQQCDEFRIDNQAHRQEVIEALTRHSIQFAIFDVLNVLHSADENDNTEMRKVMALFSEVQAKAKCAIGLVHHLGKADGKWTRRLRGASAIHGWVEWLLGISEDKGLRTMEVEVKAAAPPNPVNYEIHVNKESRVARLDVVGAAQINTGSYM